MNQYCSHLSGPAPLAAHSRVFEAEQGMEGSGGRRSAAGSGRDSDAESKEEWGPGEGTFVAGDRIRLEDVGDVEFEGATCDD